MYEFFVTRLRTRPDVIGPYVALLTDGGNRGRRARRQDRVAQAADGSRLPGRVRAPSSPAPDRGQRRRRRDGTPRSAKLAGLVEAVLAERRGRCGGLPAVRARLGARGRVRDDRRLPRPPAADRALDTPAAHPSRRLRGVHDLAEPQDPQGRAARRPEARGNLRRPALGGDPADARRSRAARPRLRPRCGIDLPAPARRRVRGHRRAAGGRADRARARLGARLPPLPRLRAGRLLALHRVRGHDGAEERRASTRPTPPTAPGSTC